MREFKEIETKEQINDQVVYYSNEYERKGNEHLHFTRFYDKELNVLEDVQVRYTNAISGLTRIAGAEKANDISLMAYKLEKLNDDFYLVKEDEDTTEKLEAIAESVKPKSW